MGKKDNSSSDLDLDSRLRSVDEDVFRGAYLELLRGYIYAEYKFRDTSIFGCLERALTMYTPRFDSLISNPNNFD
jgi:hypothetical protein